MSPECAYDNLMRHLRTMALVESTLEMLAWDELTLIPDAATEHRGGQLAWLAGRHHQLAIDPRIGEWLAAVEGSPMVADPHSPATANVREARRQHERLLRLPRSLVEELARVTAAAQHEWKLARAASDFQHFEPWLAAVVTLKREQALCLADGKPLFDPLLAEYEPGLTAADVSAMFAVLGRELTALVPEVLQLQSRSAACGTLRMRGHFPEEAQRQLCRSLAGQLGFDFQRGQLDTAVHPFSTHLGPHDVRMAIRCDSHDLRESIYALLHETGHALYDQGLPPEHFGTPAGDAISLGVHESQARLWEIAVGKSRGFWRYFFPQLAAAIPSALAGATPEQVWREVNRVEPGIQRVGADEVTYNLHIVLRFELEQALLSRDLPAGDLPGAWNERQQALLGVSPADDRAGCLQDGHWAAGMFGYFPTYTIGNVFAAQLFERIAADLGDVESQFDVGDFQPLRDWLAAHVYQRGKRFTTAELCQELCGRALDPGVLARGLSRKHRELWADSV
jgi:carboxypeptidase Taq